MMQMFVSTTTSYLFTISRRKQIKIRGFNFKITASKQRLWNFESNWTVTLVFDSIWNEHNYSKFLNTYCHQLLTYLTEWRRFFTLATS